MNDEITVRLREDFPILSREVYGKTLVYLDNAATTQKPRCVVEAISDEYYNVNANVHRGVHFLSQQATELHEQSRETVRQFIGADSTSEIVFTRGTTESINLLASCLRQIGTLNAKENGCGNPQKKNAQREIIVSTLEHHSNIVPWQLNGFKVRPIPMIDNGMPDMDAYRLMFNENTALVAVTQVSNVLGTINPVKEIIRIAHDNNICVLIDGAQSTPHMKVDVKDMDCDFFAFSGHKIYGPTGVGVLYGKERLLEQLPPYQGGGEMIRNVSFELTTFNDLPYKFEAGTPDYVGTHSLAAALDYVTAVGMDCIHHHEQELYRYAVKQMMEIEGMVIYGVTDGQGQMLNADISECAGPISFKVGNIHHLDLGTLLDRLGIAIRTGHHCAEPLMHRLGIEGTARASFGLYNTFDEIDRFVAGIRRVAQMFG
ncbi:MAG: SufS family cysteine desulfurase [Bacteroidaceae bacterium]|nr:SufS family cysteine desulfurase [Bacteroidaceae bacterium]